jgi:hypothetical protein
MRGFLQPNAKKLVLYTQGFGPPPHLLGVILVKIYISAVMLALCFCSNIAYAGTTPITNGQLIDAIMGGTPLERLAADYPSTVNRHLCDDLQSEKTGELKDAGCLVLGLPVAIPNTKEFAFGMVFSYPDGRAAFASVDFDIKTINKLGYGATTVSQAEIVQYYRSYLDELARAKLYHYSAGDDLKTTEFFGADQAMFILRLDKTNPENPSFSFEIRPKRWEMRNQTN